MIRAIDFQKVDMSNEEYLYYQELVKKFTTGSINGADYFKNLFITDSLGMITLIKPSKAIPWDIIFFIQNLTINQHLRENDRKIDKLQQQINDLKK